MKYAPILRRVVAYLIDCVLTFAVFVTALQFFLFVPIRNILFNSETWFRSGWNTEMYTLFTISLPIWIYFIFCELSPWQATVGKRYLKLRTLDSRTHQKISLIQAIIRTAIKLLPWELAHFTNNVPIPMWYDPNPSFRVGFAIIPLLIALYVIVAQLMPTKQGLHDLAAKTIVVSNG